MSSRILVFLLKSFFSTIQTIFCIFFRWYPHHFSLSHFSLSLSLTPPSLFSLLPLSHSSLSIHSSLSYSSLSLSPYLCLFNYAFLPASTYLPMCIYLPTSTYLPIYINTPTYVYLPLYVNLPSSTYLPLLIPNYQYIIAADLGAVIGLVYLYIIVSTEFSKKLALDIFGGHSRALFLIFHLFNTVDSK